jgi:hypothetical protein
MESATTHSKRSVLIGALFGMAALAATIAGVGAIAGAQDDPDTETTVASTDDADVDETDDTDDADHLAFGEDLEEFEACMSEQLGDLWIDPGEFDFGDLDLGELGGHLEAFGELDFGELELGDIDLGDIDLGELGGHLEAFGELDLSELDLGEFGDQFEAFGEGGLAFGGAFPFDEATGQQFADADEACREFLPDDVQAEMAAFDEFGDCVKDAGAFGSDFSDGTVVRIETPDGFQQVEFGEAEGSVTITGTSDGVAVTSTGGVTVLDEAAFDAKWEAFDDAHEACADLLPDDLFGGFGAFGEFEMFDMDHTDS